MPEAGGSARLSDLESRWRFDRSPRVFLQLADELRRTGALGRAIEVLQEGLSHHPESVSGRVALGRAQLEGGDASAAAETLERVLARDPAQIVASKLLIETWIRMGDASRARERLDIYRILQERDSEIDEYERRISAMERSERMPGIELAGTVAAAGEPAGSRDPRPDAGGEPLFDLDRAPVPAPLVLRPEVARVSAAPSENPGDRPESAAASSDQRSPFGRIHDPIAGGARILSFFRTEAIFPVPAAASAPVDAGTSDRIATESVGLEPAVTDVAPPMPELRAGPEAGAIEAEVPQVAGIGESPVVESIAAAPEPIVAAAPAGELAPGMTFEQFSTTGFAAEVERESLVEPLADVLGRAGLDAEALPAIAHPAGAELFPSGPTGIEPPDLTHHEAEATATLEAAAEATPASAAREAPSATLARLYLDQGHLPEAEAEFRRVLEARADDESALAGLREVARRRASDETVSGWADGDAAPVPPRAHRSAGLTQRKVETLRAYLERIRRARTRANVS